MLSIFLKCEVALLLHLPCTGAEIKCHGNNICEKVQMGRGMVALRNIVVTTAVHTQGLGTTLRWSKLPDLQVLPFFAS